MSNPPFGSYLTELEKAMGSSRARDFIGNLNQLWGKSFASTRTIVVPPLTQGVPAGGGTSTDISGGGGGGGASGADSIQIDTNGKNLQVGTLAFYAGDNVEVADAMTSYPATHYVSAENGPNVTLRKWTIDSPVLDTGSGDDGSGLLWLYVDGGITRDKSDLVDSMGGYQPGVQRVQFVGTWNGQSFPISAPDNTVQAAIQLLGAFGA